MLDSETPNITISSPGYGSQGYSADTYCQWIIMAPAGSRLGVRFGETFDTGKCESVNIMMYVCMYV